GRAAPGVPPALLFGVSALFALAGVGISLLRRGIGINLALGGLLLLAWWAGAIIGFGYGLPMLPLLGPSLAIALAMWMMDLLIGRGERQQREFIQRTFSRYVAPAVVEELIRNPESAAVSGRRRNASFIFTDIAGFTTLSEQLEPEALSDLLNGYLDGACKIIMRHEGTIDKFIGDAIMTVFNAPVTQPDHADRAVKCALEVDSYAEQFRRDANAQGVLMGVTRIGVHCGEAVIGNFGSQSRMDFTALGDTVNTAARTEGANKYFGTRVCCTQSIVDSCPERRFRKIGDILLKGKLTATGLYVPVADHDDPALIGDYDSAYALLLAEQQDAQPRFEALVDRFPDDPLARFHLDRIVAGKRTTMVVMDDK
ncbi:adenylate/guanylate cyclase domain-containing protein, partial [Sandarakinorhabdus sp.]|uniref:adenylate/guanylate cyclase domain-containing protein n=1 Tax=Sandarakinorhabdus sp. TaxID=1916663 RepID=UPI003569C931